MADRQQDDGDTDILRIDVLTLASGGLDRIAMSVPTAVWGRATFVRALETMDGPPLQFGNGTYSPATTS